MRTQSENKQTAWSEGKREWSRRWCFKSGIWLVEVVTRVSKTNDGAKKCETKIFRITVDIQLETAAVYRTEEWMQFCSPPFQRSIWLAPTFIISINTPSLGGLRFHISTRFFLSILSRWDNSFHPTNLINEFTFRRSGNSLNIIKLHFLRLNQFF